MHTQVLTYTYIHTYIHTLCRRVLNHIKLCHNVDKLGAHYPKVSFVCLCVYLSNSRSIKQMATLLQDKWVSEQLPAAHVRNFFCLY